MALVTQTVPKRYEEQFEGKDKEEVTRIIGDLHATYMERLHVAQAEYHQAVRGVNRASHEVSRIERHLERIANFCEKNDISVTE